MKIKTIRTVLVISVALLVISEFFKWTSFFFGNIAGLFGGIVTAVVFIVCGKMARAGIRYNVWILVPTVLFTIIPTVSKIWRFFTDNDASFLQQLWQYGPYFLGFILPVVMLLAVYLALGKHIPSETVGPEAFVSLLEDSTI